MTAIILDLDNCISNDEWRIPKINWSLPPKRRWDDYHSLAAFDSCWNHNLFVGTPHDIIIFTARPVFVRAMTEEWLRRNGIKPQVMLMRNNDDHCPSVILKAKHLNWLFQLYGYKKADIIHAYDDRQDIVNMYIMNGIPATRCAIHNICAATNPLTKEKA